MTRQLRKSLLFTALLAAIFAAAALAADEPHNKFNETKKHDQEYTGQITMFLPKAGNVTVTARDKDPIKVKLAADCMFFTKQKKDAASIADFKLHDDVRVLYREVDGKLVCDAMWEPGSDPSQKEAKEQKDAK